MARKSFLFRFHLDSGEGPLSARVIGLKAAVARCGGLIDEEAAGFEDGPCLDLFVSARDPLEFWDDMDDALLWRPQIARSLVVTCEGREGWDDCRLLHHFDQDEPLGELDDECC